MIPLEVIELLPVIDLKTSMGVLLHAVSLFYVMVERKRSQKASCKRSTWKGEAE